MEATTHRKVPLLRNSKQDWIIAAVLALIALIGVSLAYATAPIRHSTLTSAEESFTHPATIGLLANEYSAQWQLPADTFNAAPVVVGGLAISSEIGAEESTIRAIDPATGDTIWSYQRDVPLCSLSKAWESVIATYRTGIGCGDAVRIDASTGTYKHTRSAIAPNDVHPIASNDRVGILSDERIELWRSDLVRTLEYGDVEAKNEPELQPHENCVISSALTRTENVGVVESCDGLEWLRLQKATPEESRSPEITQDILLPGIGNQIVAINPNGAAVYIAQTPEIISYDADGTIIARQPVAPSPLIDAPRGDSNTAFIAQTADLPHNMTWFDGDRLYLFRPSELTLTHTFEDAIGTGIPLGGALLYPTAEGWKWVDWDTGEIKRTVPIDREGYTGPVSLAFSGNVIIEKRGPLIVGLQPNVGQATITSI